MDYSLLKKAIDKIVILTEDDFSLFINYTSRRQFKKGDLLLKEGEICRSFFFVESGYLRTWYNKDGTHINQSFTFETDLTTIIKSIRDQLPSDFNIEAGEDSTVWIINLGLLTAEVATRPQLGRFVKKVAVKLLLAAEEHNDLLKFHSPVERYQYIEKNNPELLQRIPLSQIASYLGIARETLSRIRARTN